MTLRCGSLSHQAPGRQSVRAVYAINAMRWRTGAGTSAAAKRRWFIRGIPALETAQEWTLVGCCRARAQMYAQERHEGSDAEASESGGGGDASAEPDSEKARRAAPRRVRGAD